MLVKVYSMIFYPIILGVMIIASNINAKDYLVSDHYDGNKFYNLDEYGKNQKSFWDVMKWKFSAKPVPWPNEIVKDNLFPQLNEPLKQEDVRVTFINHACLLIEMNGLRILTDPVLSQKLGPFGFLNLKRYREPGVSLSTLPKIDVIFISHNHYDHMDLPTLELIDARDKPLYVLPLGMGTYLPNDLHKRIVEKDWWETYSYKGVNISVVPAHHWSRRSLFDMNKSLWGGAIFEANGRKVYFAGDTGFSKHFSLIKEKKGAMDISLLPIGAYEPRWFMKEHHTNPNDSVMAHSILKSKFSIGIHFGTFRLTDEGIEDPVKDLALSLHKNNIDPSAFIAPKNGQTFFFTDSKAVFK